MRKIIIIGLTLMLTSCALQRRQAMLVDVVPEGEEDTQASRILKCVDKYKGEGFQKAYEICKDLHTME